MLSITTQNTKLKLKLRCRRLRQDEWKDDECSLIRLQMKKMDEGYRSRRVTKNVASVMVETITFCSVNNKIVLTKTTIQQETVHRCILFISLTLYSNDISVVHNLTFTNVLHRNRRTVITSWRSTIEITVSTITLTIHHRHNMSFLIHIQLTAANQHSSYWYILLPYLDVVLHNVATNTK